MKFFRDFVSPTEELYSFGEPLIYFSEDKLFPLLCSKISERDGFSFYLAVLASNKDVSNLAEGKISLRSAFYQPWCWILKMRPDYGVEAAKGSSADTLPGQYFADYGVGLLPEHGTIYDELYAENAENSFLQVKFQGPDLHYGLISFSIFRSLVGNLYSALAGVFVTTVNQAVQQMDGAIPSETALRRMLNMPMTQPRLASLSINLYQPTIEVGNVKNYRLKNHINVDALFNKRNQFLFDQTKEIVTLADKNQLSNDLLARDNVIVEALQKIVPGEDSRFSSISISGRSLNKKQSLTVNTYQGQLIRNAALAMQRSKRVIVGKVVEFNLISGSIIVRTENGRDVTCNIPYQGVRDAIQNYRSGEKIHLEGHFTERSRRDLLQVDRLVLSDGRVIDRYADQ